MAKSTASKRGASKVKVKKTPAKAQKSAKPVKAAKPRKPAPSARKPTKAAKPAATAKPRAGFRTIDYGDGVHGLMLLGSGYAWESIGRHFANELSLGSQLKFDCEGSMFVVRSSEPAVLATLQAKLDPVLADRAQFKKLVAQLGEA